MVPGRSQLKCFTNVNPFNDRYTLGGRYHYLHFTEEETETQLATK